MKTRILAFINYLGISVRQFEMTCGMSNGSVNNIHTGIRADRLEKILNAYPQLNREWLVFGNGDMINKGAGTNMQIIGDNNHHNTQSISTMNMDAMRVELESLKQMCDKLQKDKENLQDNVNKLQELVNKLAEQNSKLIEKL